MEGTETKEMECPHCGWKWNPRIENPKYCPGCKRTLETPPKIAERKQLLDTQSFNPLRGASYVVCSKCSEPAEYKLEGQNYCQQHYIEEISSRPRLTTEQVMEQIRAGL